MPSRIPKVGSTYYFRRAVPSELRPYFLTERMKPRTEFMISLEEKDSAPAKDKWLLVAVRVAALLKEAQAKLAQGIPPEHVATAQAKAKAALLAPRELAEFDAVQAGVEHDYRLAAKEDEAMERRGPQRRAIIERLSRPRAEMSSAELALRDMISEDEFMPLEQKAARAAQRAAEWRALSGQMHRPVRGRV